MASESAGLLVLPAELIDMVARELPPSKLLLFRATCREIAGATEKTFLRTHFRDRTFLFSDRYSMEALRDISQHTTFAKSLKKIELVTGNLPDVDGCRPGPSAKERANYQVFKRNIQRLKQNAEDFNMRSSDVRLLVASLQNFKKAANLPAISFSNRCVWSSERVPWGYARLEYLLGGHSPLTNRQRSVDTYTSVYRAIEDARYPVQELELGDSFVGMPLDTLVHPSICFIFSQLRSLRMVIHSGGEHTRLLEEQQCLNQLVGLQNLERLELQFLDFEYFYEDERMAGFDRRMFVFLMEMNFDGKTLKCGGRSKLLGNLRELELTGCDVALDVLMTFVCDRRQTLQKLVLRELRDGKRVCPDVAELLSAVMDKKDFVVTAEKCYEGRDYHEHSNDEEDWDEDDSDEWDEEDDAYYFPDGWQKQLDVGYREP